MKDKLLKLHDYLLSNGYIKDADRIYSILGNYYIREFDDLYKWWNFLAEIVSDIR